MWILMPYLNGIKPTIFGLISLLGVTGLKFTQLMEAVDINNNDHCVLYHFISLDNGELFKENLFHSYVQEKVLLCDQTSEKACQSICHNE